LHIYRTFLRENIFVYKNIVLFLFVVNTSFIRSWKILTILFNQHLVAFISIYYFLCSISFILHEFLLLPSFLKSFSIISKIYTSIAYKGAYVFSSIIICCFFFFFLNILASQHIHGVIHCFYFQ
jgi:hypothetical protein